MRLTEAEYAELMRKRPQARNSAPPSAEREPEGRRRVATSAESAPARPKFKSKAEARYALHLDALRLAGEIRAWDYEALTLVVGRAGSMITRYTPDFTVEDRDGRIELREVKGTYIREDARVKLLAAVRQWPGFRWMLVIDRRGTFSEEWL